MTKMYKMLNNRKGFTLIELIVVIAIIAILAAVAVPRISGFTDTAKKNTDMANAKMLNNAVQLYEANEGAYPKITEATIAALETTLKAKNYLPADQTITKQSTSGTINIKVTGTAPDLTCTGVTYTP